MLGLQIPLHFAPMLITMLFMHSIVIAWMAMSWHEARRFRQNGRTIAATREYAISIGAALALLIFDSGIYSVVIERGSGIFPL